MESKILERLATLGRALKQPEMAAVIATYGLLIKLLLVPGAPIIELGALFLALLAQLGHSHMKLRSVTDDHVASLERVQGDLKKATDWISSQANIQAFKR